MPVVRGDGARGRKESVSLLHAAASFFFVIAQVIESEGSLPVVTGRLGCMLHYLHLVGHNTINIPSHVFSDALQRLVFPHDVLQLLSDDVESLEGQSQSEGLVVEPARNVLERFQQPLPEGLDLGLVTGNIVVEASASEDLRYTSVLNLALLQTATNTARAETSGHRESYWRSRHPGVRHVREGKPGALSLVECRDGCGQVDTRLDAPRIQHRCSATKTQPPLHRCRLLPLRRFLDLPVDMMRRIWWAESIEDPTGAPRPSLWKV